MPAPNSLALVQVTHGAGIIGRSREDRGRCRYLQTYPAPAGRGADLTSLKSIAVASFVPAPDRRYA